MTTYDTNLASEFHVLSCLHRLGAQASLTLGNKKSVDIFVACGSKTVTIEVKGVAGPYDWPADNIPQEHRNSHFVVLVSYNGQIANTTISPLIWVIPQHMIGKYIRQYKNRRNVSRAVVRRDGGRYQDAWHLIVGEDVK